MGFGGSNSTVRDDDGDDTSSGVGITAFGIAMLSLIALVFVAAVLQHGVRMCTSHAAQHGGSFRPSPEAGGRASREGLGPRAEEWENNTAYTSLSNQSDVTEGHIKLEQVRNCSDSGSCALANDPDPSFTSAPICAAPTCNVSTLRFALSVPSVKGAWRRLGGDQGRGTGNGTIKRRLER